MKVFIADDSVLVKERVISMLSDLSFIEIIGKAENADEAIEKVRELKPDVVILDIRMPGNGIIALQKIKEIENAPTVIMFTNYPYEQYRKKCLDSGAEHFFSKSEGIEKIINVLNQIDHNSKNEFKE